MFSYIEIDEDVGYTLISHEHTVFKKATTNPYCNLYRKQIIEMPGKCFTSDNGYGSHTYFECRDRSCDFDICFKCLQANEFIKLLMQKDQVAC